MLAKAVQISNSCAARVREGKSDPLRLNVRSRDHRARKGDQMQRKPIVGVMGSGSEEYRDLADLAGEVVARSGAHLLTGGGFGVMEAVSSAFTATPGRTGVCIGIIKGEVSERAGSSSQEGAAKGASQGQSTGVHRNYRPGNVNPYVEIPIYTHLPLSGTEGKELMSRNHINALSADIFIVLPGGPGTFSEVMLRLEYGRKLILFIGDHDIDGKKADYFSALPAAASLIRIASSRGELEQMIDRAVMY
jgi:predicted Rossmann-fold nucleotide-binding protein